MNSTKITGLTPLNIAALQQAIDDGHLQHQAPTLTKTTATFPASPRIAWEAVIEAKRQLAAAHGSREHPVASIHAPIRKLATAASK